MPPSTAHPNPAVVAPDEAACHTVTGTPGSVSSSWAASSSIAATNPHMPTASDAPSGIIHGRPPAAPTSAARVSMISSRWR